MIVGMFGCRGKKKEKKGKEKGSEIENELTIFRNCDL
jgi:hypothetical protein